MYEKFRISTNDLIYFLMWSMFNFNVTCGLCPMVFSNGYVDPSCESGWFCNVYCNPGFVKTFNWLHCQNGVNWVPDSSSVCQKLVPCAPRFDGGYVGLFCSGHPGDSCTFYCDPGFVKTGNQLICGKYGMWIQDEYSSCMKSDTCLCPEVFNGGYVNPSCRRHPGDSCTFYCNPEFVKKGYWLTCGENGTWIPDANSICIQSVEHSSSNSEPKSTVGAIIAATTPVLVVMIIIIIFCILVWKTKRGSSEQNSQRVSGDAGGTCLRPRENRDQNLTTLRQQPNADGINSVSSFESPSYNGIYVHSFEQRIPSISSSCKYYEPPPSYTEIQIATNEAPPTYKEAVRDNTSFNLYI